MFCLPFSIPYAAPAERCDFIFSSSKNTAPTGSLYAVHVTRQWPHGGVLKMANEPDGFVRMTIHFALGHMVYPHPMNSWEAMPIAILVPIEGLRNQLVNVSTQDAYILGDLKIPKGSILIVRGDVEIPRQFPIPVIQFSSDKTLRSAVENFLGGSQQKFDNTKEFWHSLGLREIQIQKMYHAESAFSKLEDILWDKVGPFFKERPQDIFLSYENDKTIQGREALQEVRALIKELGLRRNAQKSLEAKCQTAEAYLNLLEAEKMLYEIHRKTLRPLIPIYGKTLLKLSSKPQDLWDFIQSKIDEWPLERHFR